MEQANQSGTLNGQKVKLNSIAFTLALFFVIVFLAVIQLFFRGAHIQTSNGLRLAVSLTVVIGIALMILIKPVWGLNFFTAFLPIQVILAQKGITNGIIITLGEIVIVLLFMLRRKKIENVSEPIIFFALFFFYCFFSALFTIHYSNLYYSYQTLLYLFNTFVFGLVFYVMRNHLYHDEILAIIRMFIYSMFLICLWLLLNYSGGRLGSAFGINPNSVAPYITFACIFGLTDYVRSKFYKVVLVLIFVLTLTLTGTRTGLLALIVGVVSLFVFSKNTKNRLVILALLAIGGFIAFSYLNKVSPQLLSRYELSGSLYDLEDFSSNRFIIWETSIQVFRQNQIIGVGFGNLGNYTEERAYLYNPGSIGVPSHNMYLDVLAELGGIGAFFFLLFIGSLVITSLKKMSYSSLSISVLITFLAIGLTGSFFINLPLSLFFIGANTPFFRISNE